MRKITIILISVFIIFLMSVSLYGQQQYPGTYQQKPWMQQQSTPFNDEVYGAVSKDGYNFIELQGPFFKHASVPDVLELTKNTKIGSKGTLLLYFVDFSDFSVAGSEKISVAASLDGRNWSQKVNVVIRNKPNNGPAVDPSLVELPDGRIRLYFFGSEAMQGDPAAASGNHKIYSAVSSDGVNFNCEQGVRFEYPSITDPAVVRLNNNEWLMFLSRGRQVLLARSKNGLNFNFDSNFNLTIGGVPGAVLLPNGTVRVFASGLGIVSAIFNPATGTLMIENGARISAGGSYILADPSCIKRVDGSYYLIFKKKPIK